MTLLLSLVDKYLFSGVPSNFIYDLVKTAWEKAHEKSWQDLYFESFDTALHDMQSILLKYGDGTAELDYDSLRKTLHHDLGTDIDIVGLHQLTRDEFKTQLAKSLQKREALIIGGHNLNQIDYEQLISRVIDHAESAFRNSVVTNEPAFRRAVLVETKNNILELEKIQDYLRLHHDIELHGVEEIKALVVSQNSKLGLMHSDILEIKKHLGIDKPRSFIRKDIESTLEKPKTKSMFATGLCSGYMLTPRPTQYFLAQEFSPNSEDLRKAISDALAEFSVRLIRADDLLESGHILCKISGLIESTAFGVYQLTKNQNRNVYLELGIALGLGRPFVLIKEKNADVASLIDGLEYFSINHYLGLKYDLGKRLENFIANLINYKYTISSAEDFSDSVVISHGELDVIDFTVPLAKAVSQMKYRPVILGDPTGELPRYLQLEGVENYAIIGKAGRMILQETIGAIQSSKYGIYRIDRDCSADAFIALGVAFGVNSPGMLTHDESAVLPSDLKGLASVPFRSYNDLMQKLPHLIQRSISK